MRTIIILTLLSTFLFSENKSRAQSSDLMGMADIQALPVMPAAARVYYGPDSAQFGELRLPAGRGPHPVAVIIHGGCWVAAIADLHFMDAMASELPKQGIATWNLEYRALGYPGSGWPNTFRDVAQGINYLRTLAPTYNLDLRHVTLVGHSAGGHLALWAAGQHNLPAGSELMVPDPLPLSGVVSLAGITDLNTYLVREGRGCGANVKELMGGLPEVYPERYRQGSPIDLLPLGRRQELITGMEDRIVPATHVATYATAAHSAGDPVRATVVPGAGHFEVVAPGSVAWRTVTKAIRKSLRRRAR